MYEQNLRSTLLGMGGAMFLLGAGNEDCSGARSSLKTGVAKEAKKLEGEGIDTLKQLVKDAAHSEVATSTEIGSLREKIAELKQEQAIATKVHDSVKMLEAEVKKLKVAQEESGGVVYSYDYDKEVRDKVQKIEEDVKSVQRGVATKGLLKKKKKKKKPVYEERESDFCRDMMGELDTIKGIANL